MFNRKKENFNIDEDKVIRESFKNAPGINEKENISPPAGADKTEETIKKVNIGRYNDPEGLTETKMNIGLWYLEHKKQMLFLFNIILITISVFSWAYVLYGLGYYFIKGMPEDRKLANELAQRNLVGHEYFLKIAPRNLGVYETESFRLDNGKYDFMAVVKNPNKDRVGRFKYSFLTDNYETEKETGFILPGETKYLLVLGQEVLGNPNIVNLKISGLEWIRLDKHTYPDWEAFYKEHMAVSAENVKFTPAKSTILTEKINLNQLDFTLENSSAYNYRSVGMIILLKQADRVVAVNKYKANDLLSGEKREVGMTWPGRLGRIDNTLVIPEIDISRDDIYIDFQGKINDEKF